MFHERFPKQIFCSVVDPSKIWTLLCWLLPFLRGDRDLVLHKNSALTNELVRNVLRIDWFAISLDGIDVVLDALLQPFCRASHFPAACRRFARSGGLKEERSIR